MLMPKMILSIMFLMFMVAMGDVRPDIQCQQGEVVASPQTGDRDYCAGCGPDTYMPLKNHQHRECFNCTKVNYSVEDIITHCNTTHDTVTICKPNFDRLIVKGVSTCSCGPFKCGLGEYFQLVDDCLPCPNDTVMDQQCHNHTECFKCEKLDDLKDPHKIEIQACNKTHPALFSCEDGYYSNQENHCFPCSPCPQANIGRRCNQSSDTVCCQCSDMGVIDMKDGPVCTSSPVRYTEQGKVSSDCLQDCNVSCKSSTDNELHNTTTEHDTSVTVNEKQVTTENGLNKTVDHNLCDWSAPNHDLVIMLLGLCVICIKIKSGYRKYRCKRNVKNNFGKIYMFFHMSKSYDLYIYPFLAVIYVLYNFKIVTGSYVIGVLCFIIYADIYCSDFPRFSFGGTQTGSNHENVEAENVESVSSSQTSHGIHSCRPSSMVTGIDNDISEGESNKLLRETKNQKEKLTCPKQNKRINRYSEGTRGRQMSIENTDENDLTTHESRQESSNNNLVQCSKIKIKSQFNKKSSKKMEHESQVYDLPNIHPSASVSNQEESGVCMRAHVEQNTPGLDLDVHKPIL